MEDNYYTYDIYEDKEELIIKTLDKYINDTIINPYLSKDKIIDMHTHTCYSDGELKPHELISLALEKGISTLAITDHDTIEGIKKVNRNDDLIVKTGIEIINGIELSVKVPKGRMHILGYGINLEDINLEYNLDDITTQAYNIGRDSNIFVNNFAIIKSAILKTKLQMNISYNAKGSLKS